MYSVDPSILTLTCIHAVRITSFNMHPCSTYNSYTSVYTILKFLLACLCSILSTYSDPVPTRGVQSNITLEDSGDIFESRASSAVTMCPSPHTPGPAGKETPVVRTHPFNFRSPVPSTPEPRSHGSRYIRMQHAYNS